MPTDCWRHVHLSADRDDRSISKFKYDAYSGSQLLNPGFFLDWLPSVKLLQIIWVTNMIPVVSVRRDFIPKFSCNFYFLYII